jgi:hypothetical protein
VPIVVWVLGGSVILGWALLAAALNPVTDTVIDGPLGYLAVLHDWIRNDVDPDLSLTTTEKFLAATRFGWPHE